jgi:outer membrane immunogenic protein
MRSAIKVFSFIGLIGLCSASAHGDEGSDMFLGAMGGVMQFDEETTDDTLDLPALTGRVGYDFNQWFGVEGRIGTTFEDDVEFSGITVDVKVPYFVSALAKLGWRSDDMGLGVYGLAGFTHAKFEASTDFGGAEITVDESDEGFSFGGGAEYFFDEHNGMNVEFMRYLDSDLDGSDYELDHIGIGYVRRF